MLNSRWARLNPLQSHYACKVFCDAIWTNDRAAAAGYDCEGALCQLCLKEVDTYEHRVCHCAHPDAMGVREHFKTTFMAINKFFHSDPLFYGRGIIQHPAEALPKPPTAGGDVTRWNPATANVDRTIDNMSGGKCFWDGSASRHPVAELRRAGWAVHFTDEDGTARATVRGPVWAHLPQSPQAAEYLSAVAAVQLLRHPTDLIGDCAGVVAALQAIMVDSIPRGMYAGLMRDTLDNGTLDLVKSVVWTPSHTALDVNASVAYEILHTGNKAVDEAAGDAREEVEDGIGRDKLKEAANFCKQATTNLKALGSLLCLWPALPRAMVRVQRTRPDKLQVCHTWRYAVHQKLWKCETCGMFKHGHEADGPPKHFGKCRPGRALERFSQAEDLGHKVEAVVVRGVPTFFCDLCGARGSWQWRKLLDPCLGVPASTGVGRWLQQAREGGAGLNQPAKEKQPKSSHTPRETRCTKPEAKSKDTNPLRNAKMASKEDRARWQLLEAGTCQEVCFPCLPKTLTPAPAPQESDAGGDDSAACQASSSSRTAAAAEAPTGTPLAEATTRSCLRSKSGRDRTAPVRGVTLDDTERVTSIASYRSLKHALWWQARELTPAPRQKGKSAAASGTATPQTDTEQQDTPRRGPGRPPGTRRPPADAPAPKAAPSSSRQPPGPKAGLKRKRELDKKDGALQQDGKDQQEPRTHPPLTVQPARQSEAPTAAELRMSALRRRIMDKQRP